MNPEESRLNMRVHKTGDAQIDEILDRGEGKRTLQGRLNRPEEGIMY